MKFSQDHLIPCCLPLGIEEMALIQPDVIILQSRKLLEDTFYELLDPSFGTFAKDTFTQFSGVFTWKMQKQSIVVSTHHPSYAVRGFGSFEAYMGDHIKHRLQTIHKWLESRPDVLTPDKNNRSSDIGTADA